MSQCCRSERTAEPLASPLRVAAIAALAVWALSLPAPGLELGEAAPQFQAPGLEGGVVSLDAYRGKVVYLDFWASWCGPCAQALPALERLRSGFPAADFQVVAVNVDRDSAAAKRFLERRPVGYPSALDPGGAIPERFGVQTMPTSFLIDRRGIVRHVHEGFRRSDIEALRERITQLVAEAR